MILGATLCAAYFSPPGGVLSRTWLRWGFLVLGALGFMDPFTLWWRARHDLAVIPFGEIEGVGHSDPSRLVDEHGWDMGSLVTRFVATGCVCLAALAVALVLDARARGQEATDP
jgi:hypothetical protein